MRCDNVGTICRTGLKFRPGEVLRVLGTSKDWDIGRCGVWGSLGLNISTDRALVAALSRLWGRAGCVGAAPRGITARCFCRGGVAGGITWIRALGWRLRGGDIGSLGVQ